MIILCMNLNISWRMYFGYSNRVCCGIYLLVKCNTTSPPIRKSIPLRCSYPNTKTSTCLDFRNGTSWLSIQDWYKTGKELSIKWILRFYTTSNSSVGRDIPKIIRSWKIKRIILTLINFKTFYIYLKSNPINTDLNLL